MKRYGNLYSQICDIENIKLAYKKAKRGKSKYAAVKEFEKDYDNKILQIQEMLVNKTFTTGEYKVETIFDGKKERVLHKLLFFPDRIVHHCLMNIVAPVFKKSLIRDTFQSIEGRGTSDARRRIVKAVHSGKYTKALKVDIRKFYPSVDNNVLKEVIKRKIKCRDTLTLVFNIIDSCKGLPIGNYTSQYFGNLYLYQLDWVFSHKKDLQYLRYCDDIVILYNGSLNNILKAVVKEVHKTKVTIKPTWVSTSLDNEGVDFAGTVATLVSKRLRKSIKLSMKLCIADIHKDNYVMVIAGFKGITTTTGSYRLYLSYVPKEFKTKNNKVLRRC